MIREIVEAAKHIKLSIRESLISVGRPSTHHGFSGAPQSRAGFVVDTLINETWKRTFTWVTIRPTTLYVCVVPKEMAVLLVERILQGTGYTYVMTVVMDNKVIFQSRDECSEYTLTSPRLPIMDLYDFITTWKFRPVPFGHVCGLQGFGRNPSDRCPACEGDTPFVRELPIVKPNRSIH